MSFLFTSRSTLTPSSSIRLANALFPTRGDANANTVTGIGFAGECVFRICLTSYEHKVARAAPKLWPVKVTLKVSSLYSSNSLRISELTVSPVEI